MGFTARVPLWFFKANQPGTGKDYTAGCAQIVYQGSAFEDNPLSRPDETQKRITSALLSGRRMIHFANCKGHIDDKSLEQAITGKTFNGRLLGSNTDLTLANEIDYSMSANTGLTYEPDMPSRLRIIELFFGGEDVNQR